MQIWKSANKFVFILKYVEDFTLKHLLLFENNMLKIEHQNTFYFLSYAHEKYVKSLFTNIQKQ